MGHPRRADAAPSPVQLLAILQAKESGIPLPEIAKRTKYSVSTIMRWWDKWGEDTAFFENIACEAPHLLSGHTFDVLYPDLERQRIFGLGQPSLRKVGVEDTPPDSSSFGLYTHRRPLTADEGDY